MPWNRFNYVTSLAPREVAEGDLISLDFTDMVPEPYTVMEGPVQLICPVVIVQGPTVWKNMISEIERDIAVVIPTINGIRKAPIYQEFRSQCYGPYIASSDTMGVSFIYADVLEGTKEILPGTPTINPNENSENSFPPPGIKVNGSGSDHKPLDVNGLGFLIGVDLDPDQLIERLLFVKRLVLKHKAYIGSAAEITTGFDIIALRGATNIQVDVMLLY